jgi:hypothetical protein
MPDVPLWWIDRAYVAIAANNEVQRRKQQDQTTQDRIAQMHGGR